MSNKTLPTVLTIFARVALLAMVVISIDESQQVFGEKSIVGPCASAFKNATAQLCHKFGKM